MRLGERWTAMDTLPGCTAHFLFEFVYLQKNFLKIPWNGKGKWQSLASRLVATLGVDLSCGNTATTNMSALLQLCFATCVAGTVIAGSAETVVGLEGRSVALPCRVTAAEKRGVHVCWGRGQPAVFSCHNTLAHMAGRRLIYRRSFRYSVSWGTRDALSPSLSIFNVQTSDSGLYHCRVELPGLFNDQTFSVLLIVAKSEGNLNAPPTTQSTGVETGKDVTESVIWWDSTIDDTIGPVVAQVQTAVGKKDVFDLWMFLGITLRSAFIVFIPAVILTAAYRIWRTNLKALTDSHRNQSEEAEADVYV
ncbi:hepatitis A virus cellular receptor 2 homolog isoform X2 [Stigmatopora argus]